MTDGSEAQDFDFADISGHFGSLAESCRSQAVGGFHPHPLPKGEGISELRKSYCRSQAVGGFHPLTLSLKGEGISELRKSYPDRSQAVGQDAFTPSAGPGQVQPSGCTGWRLAVALACWRGDRRKKRFSMPFRAAPTRRRDQGCVRGWSYSRGLGVGWGCGSSCSWRSWDIREPQWLYGFRPVAKGWGFA